MKEETADDRRMEVLGGMRPVYVLGAGFSRAIHDAMPLTDELGKSVREKLGLQWPQGYEDSSFEEQLTVLSTPLPFLEGHENTARRASAEHITAQLARELTDRSSMATLDSPPNWLLQLVSIWHAENAVVLTFNYDTLVEQPLPRFYQRWRVENLPPPCTEAKLSTPHRPQLRRIRSGTPQGPTVTPFGCSSYTDRSTGSGHRGTVALSSANRTSRGSGNSQTTARRR